MCKDKKMSQHITESDYLKSLEGILAVSIRKRLDLKAKAFATAQEIDGWDAAIIGQRYRIQQLKS